MVRAPDTITLKSAHLCCGHCRPEIGVFTGAFNNTSPTRVARNIDHWRKRPVDAGGARFAGSNALGALHHFRVPRSSHSNWHGEDRVKTVNDVEAEDKRNFKARFGDGYFLQAIDECRISDKKQRANLSFPDSRIN